MLRRAAGRAGWALLALVGACTDPVFVDDAGPDAAAVDATIGAASPMPGSDTGVNLTSCVGSACGEDAAVPDAGADAGLDSSVPSVVDLAPEAGLDPVREKWAGRYAARSTLFAFDDPLRNTGKLLSIITISPTQAGGLQLEEQMCFYEGGWSFLVTGQLQYTFNGTKGVTPLIYTEDKFGTDLMTLRVGYGPTPPQCRPGLSLDKGDRPWLTGSSTCDCPRSDDGPPTSPRDCRVIDQEDDDKAGASFTATIETSQIAYRVTQQERVQLSDGYKLQDRMYANRRFEDTTMILDCTINGTLTTASACPGGRPLNCPSKYNQVEMLEVDGSYDCAKVTAQERGLFPTPPPEYPAACPAEVTGSAGGAKP